MSTTTWLLAFGLALMLIGCGGGGEPDDLAPSADTRPTINPVNCQSPGRCG